MKKYPYAIYYAIAEANKEVVVLAYGKPVKLPIS